MSVYVTEKEIVVPKYTKKILNLISNQTRNAKLDHSEISFYNHQNSKK